MGANAGSDKRNNLFVLFNKSYTAKMSKSSYELASITHLLQYFYSTVMSNIFNENKI